MQQITLDLQLGTINKNCNFYINFFFYSVFHDVKADDMKVIKIFLFDMLFTKLYVILRVVSKYRHVLLLSKTSLSSTFGNLFRFTLSEKLVK